WHLVLLVAMFFAEVAKNAWGDVYDYISGNDLAVAPEDRTNFSGGKRVIVDGLLSIRQTWYVAFVFGIAALVLGAVIVFVREPAVFWIGMAGLIIGWSYHGPPLRLAYHGFGELAVVLCYGPIIVMSTYLIQTHTYSVETLWLAFPLGLFIAAFLWVNEFPDYNADVIANKRNLVARLGRLNASRLLPAIYLGGFVLLLVAPFYSAIPRWSWLGFMAVPPAFFACLWTWQQPDSFHRYKPVQPFALMTFVVFALGAGAGVVVGE
ncbi:MAG: prenyltransferase, partial [Gammaproteobacteria bacterium]|nr:prenyltransferase [Gammaproteobacteria bacterium]